MEGIKAENDKYIVRCNDEGVLLVSDKTMPGDGSALNLFGSNYSYLHGEWNVTPQIFISPDSKYFIVTYGIGYIYFIDAHTKKLIKKMKLFDDVCYEDESYKGIDLCCYYNELTQVDFSNTGCYAAVRVRGDYDPQEGDGRKELFTPIFFRSVFVIDLHTLTICLRETYDDVQEKGGRNLASISFDPTDSYFATGALGNMIKIFSLKDNKCVGSYMSLGWIPDPCGIRDCQLISFLDDENFIYVDQEYNVQRITRRDNVWLASGKIYTMLPPRVQVSKGVYSEWSYIDDIKVNLPMNILKCHTNGSRKEFRKERIYNLVFHEGNTE